MRNGPCHQDSGQLEKDKAVNYQVQFNVIHALKKCAQDMGAQKKRQTSDLQGQEKASQE